MPLVFDLRGVLYILLCTAMVLVGGAVWAVRRRTSGRGAAPMAGDASLFDVLDQAPFGVLVLEAGAVRYVNAEARALLHLPEDGLDQLPLTDWSELLREDLDVLRRDSPLGTDVPPAASSGRFRNVTFASGDTVRWWVVAQGARDVVILLDISAQQRATQTGRSLISDLGHELRTPIATLLTHLQILGLDDVGHDVHTQSLQLAQREAQRMSRLVNDMLELGRLEMAETLARRPLNLLKLVEEVVLQVAPQSTEHGISLEVSSEGALPLVAGNADRLRQVLINLLDNAVKYAGAGARVTVTLEAVTEGVRCAVQDTGPGIGEEHLPHITRRFYRAAPDTVEGSGLGLALVAEILRRHDAALDILSPVAAGRGTCVRFVLPTAERTPHSPVLPEALSGERSRSVQP